MKKFNRVNLSGRLAGYELNRGTTKNGDEFINGTISLIVDENGTTVDKIRVFATPVWKKSGKANGNYTMLDKMEQGEFQVGADNGEWLAIQGTIDISYFPPRNPDPNDPEPARSQRVNATFINANTKKVYQNTWSCDYLMTNIREIEADPERNLDRYVRVHGYVVDEYNEILLEAEFDVRKEAAINYFLGLQASEDMPYFVSVGGEMTMVVRSVTIPNAIGDDEHREFTNLRWCVTRINPTPYTFGDEADITVDQYNEFKANLQEKKAEAMKDDKEPDLAF